MKNRPLIVSFYTEGTPYEKEANDLIASCKKFDLEYDIVSTPNLGSWSANCCFKPQFLLNKLEEHNRPLVWTDVDSVFVKHPALFDECYADVALRINDQVPSDSKSKIMTGTLFVNNTLSAKKLLSLWKKECERSLQNGKNQLVFDQDCLRKVVLHYPTIVEIKRLPISYLKVIDHPEDMKAAEENAVIVHYQASRLYQKMIDGELATALVDTLSSEELKKVRT